MYILSHISIGKPSSPDHMKPVVLFSPGMDQHSFRTVGIALIILERSTAMSCTHITQIQSFTYPYRKKCLILGEHGGQNTGPPRQIYLPGNILSRNIRTFLL